MPQATKRSRPSTGPGQDGRASRSDLVERNRELSGLLGWAPEEFGARRYDADLVQKIEDFQRNRMLEVTGLGDALTVKVLRVYLELVVIRLRQEDRFRWLADHDSPDRYPEAHEQVVRTKPLRGQALIPPVPPDPDEASRFAVLAGTPRILDSCPDFAGHRFLVYPVREGDQWGHGREAAQIVAGFGCAGVFYRVTSNDWLRLGETNGKMIHAFREGYRSVDPDSLLVAHCDTPSRWFGPRRYTTYWYHWGTYDAVYAPIPGARARSCPRAELGAVAANRVWYNLGHVPCAFSYYAYQPYQYSDEGDIIRFKDKLLRTGAPAWGWQGPTEGKLYEAFWCDDPVELHNVDYRVPRGIINAGIGRLRREKCRRRDAGRRGAEGKAHGDSPPAD